MSTLASFIVRCLCVLLPGAFLLVVGAWQCRAWQAWSPGETHFPFTRDDEISRAIVIAWAMLVVLQMLRAWRVPLAKEYGPALRGASIQHAIVFCLAALMLDAGLAMLSCFLAATLFWITVGTIVARRPSSPTAFDIAVISHGFWCLCFFVTSIAYLVQHLIETRGPAILAAVLDTLATRTPLHFG